MNPRTRPDRLAKLVVVVVAALAMVTPLRPSIADSDDFAGITLRVATYGGSWRDRIHELVGTEFEKRGGKVEYVVGNPRDNLAKLIVARGQVPPPFDVMELADSSKTEVDKSDFLSELDYSMLPNANALPGRYRQPTRVGTWISEEGIVYNAEKFRENDIPPPARYEDLAHPELAGRVSIPDINVGMAVNALIGFAIDGGGDEGDIAPGLDIINDIDVASYYRSSVDLMTQFKAGDVWAAPWHAGWALRGRRAGIPLNMSFPEVKDKKGLLSVGWMGVVKGTEHAEAAHFFVNRYISAEAEEALARANGVGVLNPDAAAALQDDEDLVELLLLTPEQIENAYNADWSKIDMRAWSRAWNRQVLGQ